MMKKEEMKKLARQIEKDLYEYNDGMYINIYNSVNEIVNVNVCLKDDYTEFYNSDDWVRGGDMLEPSEVSDNDFVITYYGLGGDGAENSFIVGNPNSESEDRALNHFAMNEISEWED